MHFSDELANPGALNLPDIASGQKELDMALSLVNAMTDKWDATKYHDEYAEALMKVIDQKIAAGGKELPPGRKAASASTKVVDIVAMLQESMKQTKKAEPKRRVRKTA